MKRMAWRRQYDHERASLLSVKLNKTLQCSIYNALHKNKAGRRWKDLVDFTLEQLKRRIEKQFTEDMSWNRYMKGEIQLDHKIPIAAFHFETPEDIDFKKCWSLENLQPMWAVENMKKGAKVERPFQPSLLIGWPASPDRTRGSGSGGVRRRPST